MQFAHEMAPQQGLQLYPSDPVAAAKMRLRMEDFMKVFNAAWGVYFTRGEDDAKIDDFAASLPQHNDFCSLTKDGKWLFGTDEPTMLDIHCAPFWEFIVGFQYGEFRNVWDRSNFAE
jgi:glutathione S-transferase